MTGKTQLENHDGLWVLEETCTDQVYGNTLLTNNTKISGNISIQITSVPSSGYSLAITDKSSTNITVGTLTSGYYPLSTSLTGTMTASTPGWFTSGTTTDTSVVVGRVIATSYALSSTSNSGTELTSVEVTPSSSTQYLNIGAGYTPKSFVKINPLSAGAVNTVTGTASTSNVTVKYRSSSYYSVYIAPSVTVNVNPGGQINAGNYSKTVSSFQAGDIWLTNLTSSTSSPSGYLSKGSVTPGSSTKYVYAPSGFLCYQSTSYSASSSSSGQYISISPINWENISGYNVNTSRTNGQSSGYSMSLSRDEMAIVLTDSTSLYYGSSSSPSSSKSVGGGCLIFNDGSNWKLLNYNDTSTQSLVSGTSTLYLRTNSGKYLRKIADPYFKDR